MPSDENPAQLWAAFFNNQAQGDANFVATYRSWGRAEQAGVNYGIEVAQPERDRPGVTQYEQVKIGVFVAWGDAYRWVIRQEALEGIAGKTRGYYGALAPWNPASRHFVRTWSQVYVNSHTDQIYAGLQVQLSAQ